MHSLPLDQRLRGRRVLLTGHTGFKGAWLTLLLRRLGAEVHGLALGPEPGALFTRARLHDALASDARVDIRDGTAVQAALDAAAPDLVLHLAAESLVRRAFHAPAATFATNVQGTVNVLEAARTRGFRGPLVVVTTDKVYANDGRDSAYEEHDRLGGDGAYAASKAASELAAAAYRQSYGLRIATVRAGNVIGGGDVCADRLMPDCNRAWAHGDPVRIRRPQATRPWQHVLEPLLGYLHVAVGILDGDTTLLRGFNLGPIEPAWPVARVLDEAVQHWPNARWIGSPEPGAPPEASKLDLQVQAVLDATPWRPRWDTREAIARTVRWERAVHDGLDPRVACERDLDARLAGGRTE